MSTSKKRVIKDFDKLEKEIQEQIKLSFPEGFSNNLIKFTNKDGLLVSALPFETEDAYYLVRMSIEEARALVEDDDDYDEDGVLKDEVRLDYKEKYSDNDETESDSDSNEDEDYGNSYEDKYDFDDEDDDYGDDIQDDSDESFDDE